MIIFNNIHYLQFSLNNAIFHSLYIYLHINIVLWFCSFLSLFKQFISWETHTFVRSFYVLIDDKCTAWKGNKVVRKYFSTTAITLPILPLSWIIMRHFLLTLQHQSCVHYWRVAHFPFNSHNTDRVIDKKNHVIFYINQVILSA